MIVSTQVIRVADEDAALGLVRHHLMLARVYLDLCPEALAASDFDDGAQVAWWRVADGEHRP